MARNILLGGLISLGMFFYGCSSRNVQSPMKSEKDLKNYKTYAWLPAGDTLMNDLNKNPELLLSVMDRVDRAMINRGYRLNLKNPDLLILVHTKNNENISQSTLPAAYTYYQPAFDAGPWFSSYYLDYKTLNNVSGKDVNAVQYPEGSIVIDFIDRKKKEIVWRGNATYSVDKNNSKLIKETVNNLDEILVEFPC